MSPAAPRSVARDLAHRSMLAALRCGEYLGEAPEHAYDFLRSLFSCPRSPDSSPGERPSTKRAHGELVRRTEIDLSRRLRDRLVIEDVARAVFSSPFHLSRVFRKYSGMTIHQYHERLRLRAAAEEILEGARDLASLALSFGFPHHSYFSERFRREFGVNPSQCRSRQFLDSQGRGSNLSGEPGPDTGRRHGDSDLQ